MDHTLEASPTAHDTSRAGALIRVLVCEDDARVRVTLTRVIEAQRDLGLMASVESGEDALAAIETMGPPDVVVLDVHLPGIDGIETLQRLRAGGVTTPVLVLSADDRAAGRLDGLDAVSFLSKGTTSALQVIEAIRREAAPDR